MEGWYAPADRVPAGGAARFHDHVFDSAGVVAAELAVADGLPTDLTRQADGYELDVAATSIQRAA